jgi:hypothetical protein
VVNRHDRHSALAIVHGAFARLRYRLQLEITASSRRGPIRCVARVMPASCPDRALVNADAPCEAPS